MNHQHIMNEEDLIKLGYDTFVQGSLANVLEDGSSIARITEVNRNSYTVTDGIREMPAELPGRFLYTVEDSVDYPTVGDWVTTQPTNDQAFAIISKVLPRKTLLKRKESGKRIEFQLIASNIDYGLVVQSADHVNLNLLDRYFLLLNESGISPIVIISKTDLVSAAKMDVLQDQFSGFSNPIHFISNPTEEGIDGLRNILFPGKTYCLLGQSGVGKSSLLNRLLDSSVLEVGATREKDGRGRHTTVRRQLVLLKSGSLFIDTPGIRELGNFQVDQGLEQTFDDLYSLAQQCRFTNCSHTHEKCCAVISAVEMGDIDENRYQNFLKLRKESGFYDMSYQDKRKKGKDVSKLIKNFKKIKGKHHKY